MKTVKKESKETRGMSKKAMKKTKGGTASLDSVADLLAQAQASSTAMLNIQAEIGAQSRTYTTVSNALNAKQAMERNVIRNMRA